MYMFDSGRGAPAVHPISHQQALQGRRSSCSRNSTYSASSASSPPRAAWRKPRNLSKRRRRTGLETSIPYTQKISSGRRVRRRNLSSQRFLLTIAWPEHRCNSAPMWSRSLVPCDFLNLLHRCHAAGAPDRGARVQLASLTAETKRSVRAFHAIKPRPERAIRARKRVRLNKCRAAMAPPPLAQRAWWLRCLFHWAELKLRRAGMGECVGS